MEMGMPFAYLVGYIMVSVSFFRVFFYSPIASFSYKNFAYAPR